MTKRIFGVIFGVVLLSSTAMCDEPTYWHQWENFGNAQRFINDVQSGVVSAFHQDKDGIVAQKVFEIITSVSKNPSSNVTALWTFKRGFSGIDESVSDICGECLKKLFSHSPNNLEIGRCILEYYLGTGDESILVQLLILLQNVYDTKIQPEAHKLLKDSVVPAMEKADLGLYIPQELEY